MITYCLQRYDFFLTPPKMPCRNVLVTSVTATTVTTSGRCANFGTKIDSRILFLGFEYFNVDYFSDLSILTRFISRI